jgi:diguanylate cyclase (GGDEF)-like protein/putative nucleotidyltransferase with HDIG domain
MSLRAWVYIFLVLLAGAAMMGWALLGAPAAEAELPAFLAFVGLATFAQFYTARAPGHQSYHFTLVFLLASALSLSPFLFVLVVAIPHLVEWARERWINSPRLRNWYLQPFNIATHVIVGLLARQVFLLVGGEPTHLTATASLLGAFLASITYDFGNHLLIGIALTTARKVPFRDSGILDFENLATDWVLLIMGVTIAVAWTLNPLLVLPALSPIWLMYQALKVPQLTQEAKTDPKTGLANARYVAEMLTNEIGRAKRFERPIAVIMADLDLLRNVNNTYGHLAGDAVLATIGQILRKMIREYDLAGRFGGEEFLLVLPETQLPEAYAISERIREMIEATGFVIPTHPTPIRVTMSFGIACFPKDAQTLNELVHQADVAVYQAKLQGRNCVVCAENIPQALRLETLPRLEEAAQIPTYTPRVVEPPVAPVAPPAPPVAAPAAASVAQPPAVPLPTLLPAQPPPQPASHRLWLPQYVALVVAAGALTALSGVLYGPPPDAEAIGLLIVLALFAQAPLVKNLYGETSTSVSMAIIFAGALLAGMAGVVLVSAVIVFVHLFQRRPLPYKTAFNWATHTLAGTFPVILVSVIPDPFQPPNLIWLGGLCLLGGVIYYLVETGLLAGAIYFAEGGKLSSIWRERFQWLLVQYVALSFMGFFLSVAYVSLNLLGVAVMLVPVLMMHLSERQYIERTAQSINELKRVNTELEVANREIVSASQTIRQINDELFLTLSKIIDARDPHVFGHSSQVAVYATAIAQELGLSQERMQNVRQAALMHDIGKIGIAESVLNKPGRLDMHEYAYVKTHAALGADFVETSQGLRHLAAFIRYHHERWDGKGYPCGLKGEQIPIEARILALSDAVETMASDRPYHRAMAAEAIIAEIERCAGTQFDPKIAQAFVRVAQKHGAQFLVNSARTVTEKPASAEATSRKPSPTSAASSLMPTGLKPAVGESGS